MLKPTGIESFKQQLAVGIARQLGLPEHPDAASFAATLGRDPQIGDRFLNTTASRVCSWDGSAWVLLCGQCHKT